MLMTRTACGGLGTLGTRVWARAGWAHGADMPMTVTIRSVKKYTLLARREPMVTFKTATLGGTVTCGVHGELENRGGGDRKTCYLLGR